MSITCCDNDNPNDYQYRKALWVCLAANAIMFFVQIAASYQSLSTSLLANALDFLSDAANYGISLFVISKSTKAKSTASIIKGGSLGILGLWVAYETLKHALTEVVPLPAIMFTISIIGLVVNLACAILLYRFRSGDINRKSVWICSRNDAIGNIAVMVAAAGVFASTTAWPDIFVAAILAYLALSGAWQIILGALKERKTTK